MRKLNLLYELAVKLKLETFDELFDEIVKEFDFTDVWEVYLIRAQLKIYISDSSFINDLLKVIDIKEKPNYPLLNTKWKMDSSNQYSISHMSNNDLLEFKKILSESISIMEKFYGVYGINTILELLCEINYFQSNFDEAKGLLKTIEDSNSLRLIDELFFYFMSYRVNLASGDWKVAEKSMLEVIRLSQKYPVCQQAYQQFKGWAVLTTNWSGDSDRFIINKEGEKVANLEDRLVAIKDGVDKLSEREYALYNYAILHFDDVYTQRMFYMDIFNAMFWFVSGDPTSALSFFDRAYTFSQATDQILPFVEYGEHILPLLEYIKNNHSEYSDKWLLKTESLAIQYENSLQAYRDVN